MSNIITKLLIAVNEMEALTLNKKFQTTLTGLLAGTFLLIAAAIPMGIQSAAENYPDAFRQSHKNPITPRADEAYDISQGIRQLYTEFTNSNHFTR